MKKAKEYQSIPFQCLPLTAWQYVGYQILFAIPIIGIFAVLATSLFAKNYNLRSFARSYICGFLVLLTVLIVIVLIFILIAGVEGLNAYIETITAYFKDYIEQFTTTA